jgi:integration host factor subunit alpha
MTKADLVANLNEKIGLSRKESAMIVELIFEIMRGALEQGEKVKIAGFGNFNVRSKKVRKGRNPQTGDDIEISARRVLSFKLSPLLRKTLNS